MIWSVETKTPHRLPLGGGGTDIISYCARFGGELTSVAIDKYIRIIINRRYLDSDIVLRYSQNERVSKASEIQHGLVRNTLKKLDINGGLEIVSLSEMPSNSGMGSSGVFTVGLLKALYALDGKSVSTHTLADTAFEIEKETYYEENPEMVGQPVPFGKHDQYIAAFGGFVNLQIDNNNSVKVNPLPISLQATAQLQEKMLIYYTSITRKATEPLSDQSQRISESADDAQQRMHTIKEIGRQITTNLQNNQIDSIGQLMKKHWDAKKGVSSKMSNSDIDRWIQIGHDHGSTGEKIMGAGGGGFILYFVPNASDREGLHQALLDEGLKKINFSFDFDGSVVTNKEIRI